MATMSRLAAMVAMAIGLTGCAEDARRFSLHGFSDDEIDIIQDAAVEWCATGAYCPRVIGGDNVIILSSSMSLAANGEEASGSIKREMDFTADGFTTIKVLDRRDYPDWESLLHRTMLHEFGHAAGCRDTGDPGHIMSAIEGDESWHLTQFDIDCAR